MRKHGYQSLYRVLIWIIISIALSGLLARSGFLHIDSKARYWHSFSLIEAYTQVFTSGSSQSTFNNLYAPLWETCLGVATEWVFPKLQDPHWVRTTLNLALFPIGLVLLYYLFVAAGVRKLSSFLVVASIFGIIRVGGHAMLNFKDFPIAMALPILSVVVWLLLRKLSVKHIYKSFLYLVFLGIFSAIPFLLRAPMLHLFALTVGVLCAVATMHRKLRPLYRVAIVIVPILSGLLFVYALSPALWNIGTLQGVSESIARFSRYDNYALTILMGKSFQPWNVPWWYPFPWFFVSLSPLTFLLTVVGLVTMPLALWWGQYPSVKLPIHWFGKMKFSLLHWLLCVLLLTWLGILLTNPNIYDEDRHFLFLYPITVCCAVLGFSSIKWDWIKQVAVVLLCITSIFSYLQWGRYAYIYKSPLLGKELAQQFQADYWGLCTPKAVLALKGRIPPGTMIYKTLEGSIAEIQYERLQHSLIVKDPDFGPYKWQWIHKSEWMDDPARRPFAVIVENRENSHQWALKYVEEGKAKIVWQDRMPSGDLACLIAYFR